MSRNPMPEGRHDEALAAAGWSCQMHRYDDTADRCSGPLVVHHRQPKGMGGSRDPAIHDLTNLAALCDHHHRTVHSNAARSYETGLLLRRRVEQ